MHICVCVQKIVNMFGIFTRNLCNYCVVFYKTTKLKSNNNIEGTTHFLVTVLEIGEQKPVLMNSIMGK